MTGLLLALVGCGVLVRGVFAERVVAQPVQAQVGAQCGPDPALDGAPEGPPPPTPASAARKGVLIVVSIPSQRLYVFKDGAEWGSTTVSTGRRGYGTPAGTFTILQKHVKHRSRTYGNAPMPYMQRLTWRGVALHAGRVTGAPASHGCIRLPYDFARQLYALTNPASTSVVILRQPLNYAEAAKSAALGLPPPLREQPVRQASAPPVPPPVTPAPRPILGAVQTIQLAAAANVAGADELWQELSSSEPELQALEPVIIPAVVRQVQVYRLRASGRDAHAICSRLTARGIACLKVIA
ncbi:L,D-transpeptidase family protein [Novosphingobium sp.]|uniref:L,D-transpeptidase family protein n=1 Tax=Novosphingobium sp. TaxID=1874826 RepID=UPI0026090FBB|nr:L,D-transpeptidase family protein [Novosphingobium sp.]